jgi:enamine deaminase RidA (YjgF/YER057c/UK114 family)
MEGSGDQTLPGLQTPFIRWYAVTDNRTLVTSGSPHEPKIGFSRAVRVGNRILVSATAPIWQDGSCDPDPGVQARRSIEIILAALGELGASAKDIVRTRMYVTDIAYAAAVGQAHSDAFGDVRPATSLVAVNGFIDSRWKVQVEAEAITNAT